VTRAVPGEAVGPRWGDGTPPEVVRFLEGPQPRRSELRVALRVLAELVRGFRALHFVGPCVTVFGSARSTEDDPYYALRARSGPGWPGWASR
jgi:hypothetical protein